MYLQGPDMPIRCLPTFYPGFDGWPPGQHFGGDVFRVAISLALQILQQPLVGSSGVFFHFGDLGFSHVDFRTR